MLFASNDNVGEFKGRKKVGQTQTFQFRMSYNYFLSVCWPFYSLFWGCCLLSTHPHQAFNNLFISTERPDSSLSHRKQLVVPQDERWIGFARGGERREEKKKIDNFNLLTKAPFYYLPCYHAPVAFSFFAPLNMSSTILSGKFSCSGQQQQSKVKNSKTPFSRPQKVSDTRWHGQKWEKMENFWVFPK